MEDIVTPRERHLAYLRAIIAEMEAILDNAQLTPESKYAQIFSDAIEGEIMNHGKQIGVIVDYYPLFNDEPDAMVHDYARAVHAAFDPLFRNNCPESS